MDFRGRALRGAVAKPTADSFLGHVLPPLNPCVVGRADRRARRAARSHVLARAVPPVPTLQFSRRFLLGGGDGAED